MLGDSAGANILALYTAICTNPSYAANFKFHAPDGFVPKAIALNCGSYVQTDDEFTKALMADYLPKKGTEEELKLNNPLHYITEKYPPVYVMTSNGDFLKGQAPMMVEVLKEKGIPHVMKCYGDEKTELSHVFHCNIKLPEANVCNDEECEFFKSWK